MRKSASIDTEAVLAKTREILEAETSLGVIKASAGVYFGHLDENGNNERPATYDEVGKYIDTALLAQVKIDQLKHEYSVLLTGAKPKKPKAKKATKAKRVTATDYLGEPAPYDRGREES